MNVKEIYQNFIKQGMSPRDAAKMTQEKTGLSAVTGRPINRQLRFTKKEIYYGQYGIPSYK